MSHVITHLAELAPPPLSISLEAIKQFLRLDHDGDDGHLEMFIRAGTVHLEQFCNTIWLPRPLLWSVVSTGTSPENAARAIRLWTMGQLRETLPGISFALPTPTRNPAENTCVLRWGDRASGEFEMMPSGTPGRAHLHLSAEAWQRHIQDLPQGEGVQLTLAMRYTGGSVENPDALPPPIRHAISLLVQDYYDRGTPTVRFDNHHPAYVLAAPYRHFSL